METSNKEIRDEIKTLHIAMNTIISNQARMEVMLASLIKNNNRNEEDIANEEEVDLLKTFKMPINDIETLTEWNSAIKQERYKTFMVRFNI